MRKNVKKVISILCCMAMFLAGLSGCSLRKEKARPIENGTLKVGMNLQIDKMCYVSSQNSMPEGFEVEVAQKIAEKLELKLEIIDTSEDNLLKSLDADLYDCVISAVGITDWNKSHYSCTDAYADITEVKEKIGENTEDTKIAVFTKKGNPMVKEINEKLVELRNDGSIGEISKKYFEKDISIPVQ